MSRPNTDNSGRIVRTVANGHTQEAPPPSAADMERREPKIADMLPRFKDDFSRVLPKHLTPDRFLRLALSALRTKPQLAECTAASFMSCLMQCAQLGLEPNTAMDHAYLIPREDKQRSERESKRQKRPVTWLECHLQIGYKGYLQLAANAGVLIRPHVVHEGDMFDYGYGENPFLRHEVSKDPKRSTRPITHTYAVASSPHFGGEKPFVVLDDAEVMERKALNPNSKRSSSPWNTSTGRKRMYEKTAVRALIAWVPQSPEQLQRAAALEDASEGARSLASSVDSSVVEALQGHGMEFPHGVDGDEEDPDERGVIDTTAEPGGGAPALPESTKNVDTVTLEEAVRGDQGQLQLNEKPKN